MTSEEELSKKITEKIILRCLDILEELENLNDKEIAWWDVEIGKEKNYVFGEFEDKEKFKKQI